MKILEEDVERTDGALKMDVQGDDSSSNKDNTRIKRDRGDQI